MARYDDPRILRAIAHPTRHRVLHELSAAGSLRAADIARTLGIPANQASFHLRQLAKYGLVEEDPDAARDKRDRVWRLVGGPISFSPAEMVAQPGGRAAYTVFERNAIARARRLVESALAYDESQPDRKKSMSEWGIRLTPAEAEKLAEEVGALVERYREAGRDADDGDEERVTYSVFQLIQPFPEDGSESPE